MKTPPSKSTRSSRASPYAGRVQGEAATAAGGIANGNAINTQQNHQGLMGIRGNQQGAIRLPNIRTAGQQGQPRFNPLTPRPVQFPRCHLPSNRNEGGDGVVQGQQQGSGGQTVQQQQVADKPNQGKMPPPPQPVAPQVQSGQRSSSPFACCALRVEIDNLQNSVSQLSQRLVIQGRKMEEMMAGVRTAALSLREALQGQESEDEDGEVDVESVDVGYDSEINMGEG